MQGGVAALIGLVNISSMVDQLSSHRLLPHVASHVERSVSESVGLVNLKRNGHEIRAILHGGARNTVTLQAKMADRWLYGYTLISLTSAPILSRYFTISM